MARCKLLPLAVLLVLHAALADVGSNIFLTGEYKNSIDSHPLISEDENSYAKNIFLEHAIFSRQAQPFSAPKYLPPKEYLKCGGGQQCVKKNVCLSGYFTNNPNGYIQNCEPETDVCCTYRPPVTTTTTTTTQRPYVACSGDSDCVAPSQCSRGTINVSNYAKKSAASRCYAPEVCCRLPATALTPDGYVLTVPQIPFPQPPAPPKYNPPAYQPPAPQPPKYNPPAYQPPAPQPPKYNPPAYQPPAPPAPPAYKPPAPPAPPAYRPPTPTSPPTYIPPAPPAPPAYQPPVTQRPQYIPPAPPAPPAYQPPKPQPPRYNPPAPQPPTVYNRPTPAPQPQPTRPAYIPPPAPQPPRVQPIRPQPAPTPRPTKEYLPPVQRPLQPRQPQQPLTPVGSPSNQVPIRGEDILSEPIFPSRAPRPQTFENDLSPFTPQKCAAALICTDVNYCNSQGIIVDSPSNLTPAQAAFRVPMTDCIIEGSGSPGKCCRDSNYVDPWPVNPTGQCATRNRNTKPRGVTDEDTSFAEIPWQAMVLKESSKSLLCGGAIIGYAMVLTTASCLQGQSTQDILVKAGEWQLGSDDEPLPFQLVRATEIEVHPGYDAASGQNNLAIILLEKNLQTAIHVSPICISDKDPSPSEKCVVTGWGKDALKIHQQGALMHQTPAEAVSRSECGASPQQVCARTKYDACNVDYGSALACGSGTSYVLKGTFTSEDQCGNSVATFTKPDIKWINTAFNQNNRALTIG